MRVKRLRRSLAFHSSSGADCWLEQRKYGTGRMADDVKRDTLAQKEKAAGEGMDAYGESGMSGRERSDDSGSGQLCQSRRGRARSIWGIVAALFKMLCGMQRAVGISVFDLSPDGNGAVYQYLYSGTKA